MSERYGWPEERNPEHEQLLREVLADYDRRMATRRGRFLLWLLRKLT